MLENGFFKTRKNGDNGINLNGAIGTPGEVKDEYGYCLICLMDCLPRSSQALSMDMEDVLTKICEVRPSLRLCAIKKAEEATCGFHLSRTQWDPYPWISNVESESPAAAAGLAIGDFVIEVNGEDILGLRIDEVAKKVRTKNDAVRLLVWKSSGTETENKLPTAFNLHKFSGFIQSTMQLLECPVCLELAATPTFQCVNGHLLCVNCRQKTTKCPMCRVTLSAKGRCLIAEKLQRLIRKTLTVGPQAEDRGRATKCSIAIPTSQSESLKSDISCMYNCPWNTTCKKRLTVESAIFPHLYSCHSGPYTQYILRDSPICISIVKLANVTFIATPYDAIFFVRYLETRECWINILGDVLKAEQFTFTISPSRKSLEKVNPCPVSSLSESASETIAQKAFINLPDNVSEVWINITSKFNRKVT